MSDTSPWLRRFGRAAVSTADAPVRLFCFPHAGGSASSFFALAQELAPDVDVLAVQYPGRQERFAEPLVDSVTGLADGVLPGLLGRIDRPFALFGHSLGASVAYEVARRLEDGGRTALALFASGRRAPSTQLEPLPFAASDDDLVAELQRMGGTPAELFADQELRDLLLPPIRNDFRAATSYAWTPGPPLATPVTALLGADDHRVGEDGAAAWERHTAGGFELRTFPGGHFYLDAQVSAVAGAVRAGLSSRPSPA